MFHPRIKLQFVLFLVLIILAFIGVILTQVESSGAWWYWRYIAVAYAILSLAQSWYVQRMGWKESAITIWHEIAHWLGVIFCIQMLSFFVSIGLESRFLVSIQALLFLALGTYLAGIYIDAVFIIVGIVLAIFAGVIAFLQEYLYAIMIPLLVF